jgi:hypothetical protein
VSIGSKCCTTQATGNELTAAVRQLQPDTEQEHSNSRIAGSSPQLFDIS